MTVQIAIDPPTSPIEWMKADPSANPPRLRPLFLSLDPERRMISIKRGYASDNSTPADVWHGRRFLFSLGTLIDADAAYDILVAAETQTLFMRACDGYSEQWDGSNHVGTLTDDAEAALTVLELLLCKLPDLNDGGGIEAGEWLSEIDVCSEYGITLGTTDGELQDLADRLETEARDDGWVILDSLFYALDDARERCP